MAIVYHLHDSTLTSESDMKNNIVGYICWDQSAAFNYICQSMKMYNLSWLILNPKNN